MVRQGEARCVALGSECWRGMEEVAVLGSGNGGGEGNGNGGEISGMDI